MKRSLVLFIIFAVCIGVYLYVKRDSADSAVAEIERVRGAISEIVEEKEVRNGEVVFYLRQDGARAPVISADYVKNSFLGWKWAAGGGHSLPAASGTKDVSWSYQYIAATKGSLWSDSPFPLLFGTFNNPAITTVIVKSVQTGQETKAEVIQSKGKVNLWYAFVPEEQGHSFELKGLTSTGQMVSEKRIYE